MDKIEQKIKNANDLELPDGLHGRIIRAFMVRRYRFPLLIVLSAIVFNVGISGLRLHASISQNGAITAFSSFFGNFSMDYDFTSDFFGLVNDYLPVHSLAIFLVNLLLAGYIAKLYFDIVKYNGYGERSSKIVN